jgi:NO-binding membrane sensor protein with MHYT domain
MLHGLLYEEDYVGSFLLVTVILGGGAAWLAGRAIARSWRPWWSTVLYMLILGVAVRFIHFALFSGTFLSPHYYVVDAGVAILFGLLGFQVTRKRQMARQYGFLGIPQPHLFPERPDAVP